MSGYFLGEDGFEELERCNECGSLCLQPHSLEYCAAMKALAVDFVNASRLIVTAKDVEDAYTAKDLAPMLQGTMMTPERAQRGALRSAIVKLWDWCRSHVKRLRERARKPSE